MPSIIRGGDDFDTNNPNEIFTSVGQVITAAALLTIPHGFTTTPTYISSCYKCVAADGGWVQNDIAYSAQDSDYASSGHIMYADETNVYVRFGSVQPMRYLINKTTGVGYNPVAASWNLIVKAFK
jgi:hypothetical protein